MPLKRGRYSRSVEALVLLSVLTMPELCLAQNAAAGESPVRKFDVVSVKSNNQGGGPYMRVLPGRLVMTYFSVQDLVAAAYGVRVEQVAGQSRDSFAERYDIEAKTDGAISGGEMVGPMLKALLDDEFKLKVRRTIRELPVYNLVVTKNGVKMPLAHGGCTPFEAASAPSRARANGGAIVYFCDRLRTGARGLKRTMEGKSISAETLAGSLARTELNRSVVNKTGLKGLFDVDLTWTTDPTVPGLSDGRGGASGQESNSEGEIPTIFTAIEQQLGLKLESGHGPVEVFVVESAAPKLN